MSSTEEDSHLLSTTTTKAERNMAVIAIRKSEITYPTGDRSFAVKQAFPAAVNETESDPFLMCDYFGPKVSEGRVAHPDHFPVGWHPHRGMDICTYMINGGGRHADSLGNREEFASPGLQWCSVGSGIEHAEGGGVPKGESMEGFQLWVNVPKTHKMKAPRYGTVPPTDLPLLNLSSGITARLIAGSLDGKSGPFATVQPMLITDIVMPPNSEISLSLASSFDTTIAYIYKGDGIANDNKAPLQSVALFDSKNSSQRGLSMSSGPSGASFMLFSGQKIKEPIAWHGPFVMNTQAEIKSTINEYQRGVFPPVRTPFDYKTLAEFPIDHPARNQNQKKKSTK
jgi:quercetin 2,3-dioxygenase